MGRSVLRSDADRLGQLVAQHAPVGDGWLAADLPVPGAAPWFRRAQGGRPATAFPPDGPWAGIALRWPRDRAGARMLVELAAARLRPGGALAVAAPNAEGGKSVAGALADLFAERDERYGSHARLVLARGPVDGLRGDPDAWRTIVETPVGPLVSWPGLFAHGRVDPGTALLLEHLPDARGARTLDFGCGAGVIARALPGADLDLVDVDALAVHAARINVPGARVHLADGVPPGLGPFDLAVSNPPLHTGSEIDPGLLRAFAAGARLRPGGEIRLVTLHTVPIPTFFPELRAERLAERRPYAVWRLRR